MESTQQIQQPTGTFKRGWLLTKASLGVLGRDKKLITFSFLNLIVSVLVIGLFVGIGFAILYATGSDFQTAREQYNNSNTLPTWIYPLVFLMLFPLFIVMNYFTACITAGALQQFRKQKPTLKSSYRAANRISGKLVVFSFYQDGGIFVIDLLSKIPLVGGLLEFLGEMAFTVGSFFVLPVMIDQGGAVGPVGAIKQSVEIIRKVWGESIVIVLGMPFIAVIAGVLYTIIWGAALVALTPSLQSATNGHEVIAAAIIISILAFGYGIIIMIYSALSSIVTAALYLYATTATAPAGFDTNLLSQMVRAKTSSDI